MSLGNQVRKIENDIAASAAYKKSQAEQAIEHARIQRRKMYKEYLEKTKCRLVDLIEEGRLPIVKLTDDRYCKWIREAMDSTTFHSSPDQDIWDEFAQIWKDEDARIELKSEHDGMGIKSWYKIQIHPA